MLTSAAKSALENFIKARPNVQLPAHLDKLNGTHGMYTGDGKSEREVAIGFRPSFVVFVIPVFPDGVPHPTDPKKPLDSYWRPELHPQPVYTEKGFKVTEAFNKVGAAHIYVAWKKP